MRKFRILAIAVVAMLVGSLAIGLVSAQDDMGDGVLDDIMARGTLNCGVSGGLPGFSIQNPDTGEWEGLDVDFCRATAIALFGEATDETLNIVPLTADVRFTALQAGEVDILHRNTTWTLTRDITLGSDFGPTTFYDGQGLLVRVEDGFTSLTDMEGASFCSTSGTTTEKNITDAYRALFGEDPVLVLGPGPQENLADLEAGACDVLTSDKSQLAGLRSASSDPSAYVVLPDTLSKEPLGPMYLEDDSSFGDIVNWVVFATFQAEEYGITSENMEEFMTSDDVNIQRFLGLTEDGYGDALGISNSFAADVIRAVGNYAEIYERNIVPIGIDRVGSLNDLWTRGGLMYSPAWR
ncbi:MAG: amino acid ABC transporter substrate-binding protein [Chloroflexota bacterium]